MHYWKWYIFASNTFNDLMIFPVLFLNADYFSMRRFFQCRYLLQNGTSDNFTDNVTVDPQPDVEGGIDDQILG